jgi:hypothetical protein
LTRSQASRRPRCCSKAILYHGAPLPSTGSARAAFPGVISTIRALRLPAPTAGQLIDSHPRSDCLPGVRSRAAGVSAQARPRSQPRCHRLFHSRSTLDLPGSWRAHPIPLPRSRTPAGPNRPHHDGRFGAVPTFVTVKTPALRESRGSITRLWYPLPTLHETCRHAPRKARFRPVASPCRMGVEPTGLQR